MFVDSNGVLVDSITETNQVTTLAGSGSLIAPEPIQALEAGGTTTRSIAYTYDALQRLIGAVETGATSNSYGYSYDNAGNRLTSTYTGGSTCPPHVTRTYNAANQVHGWCFQRQTQGETGWQE